MSYILEEGYPKLQNIDKYHNDLSIEYRDLFAEEPPNIEDAQDLIIDDIEDDDYNGYLALNALKMIGVCNELGILQSFWQNAKDQVLEWFINLGQEVEVYNSANIYNKNNIVSYNGDYYICILDNVTGTFNIEKWHLLTPNDLGLDILDDVTFNEEDGKILMEVDSEEVGQFLPDIVFVDDISTLEVGSIYITEYTEGE